jgi:hypothetical protein
MFFDEAAQEWRAHPDCTCGQGNDYKLRAINRPCYCSFLNPLDSKGVPIRYPVMEALRKRDLV